MLQVTATAISSCGDIVLDATGSIGHAGRPWRSILWTVTSSNNATAVQGVLNSLGRKTSQGTTIPNSLLSPGAYSFTLQLTNFLGALSASTVTVTVSGRTVQPSVLISNAASTYIYRSGQLSVFAVGTVSSCGISASPVLAYRWYLYTDGLLMTSPLSVAVDPKHFLLQPYSLQASSSYTLAVVATSPSGASASSSMQIVVGRTGVAALIASGDARVQSSGLPLVMDASGSYDIDYPDQSGALAFAWACSVSSPDFGSSCGVFPLTGSVVTVPANTLPPKVYSFTVFVTSVDGYSANKTVLVSVTALEIPSVTVGTLLGKVNPDFKLTINSTISGSSPMSASWSCADCPFPLSVTTQSITSGTSLFPPYSRHFARGTLLFPLVLAKNLMPPGRTFTFKISVRYVSNSVAAALAEASVSVTVNSAPFGGLFSVTPSRGEAVNTKFLLSTSGWTDDLSDYPLLYVISYYSFDNSAAQTLKSSSEVTYVVSVLGQGLSTLGYNVTATVSATDKYGAATTSSRVVKVVPLGSLSSSASRGSLSLTSENSAGALSGSAVASIRELLHSSLQTFDATGVMQVVAAVVNSINSADCSLTDFTCADRNRQPCSSTANTCGPCLDGYIGVPGSSNAHCVSSNANATLASDCSTDANCPFGPCDVGSGVCTVGSKTCPGGCSSASQGSCGFYDWAGAPTTSCNTSDVYCSASCSCAAGFYGEDCSVTTASFATQSGVRELSCTSLYNATLIQVNQRD